MRQLTFLEKGKLEWRDVPEPALEGGGEALVKPLVVATCDLDLWLARGKLPYEGELPIGHEGVAEVIDVGDAVSSVKPGDLVSVPFQVACGECHACSRGRTGNCERVGRMATYGLPIGENHGGFLSDAVRVPFADAMLLAVPDGIEPEAIASLSDNIPDAWRSVGPQLEQDPGSELLVCGGAGSIALYAVAIAVALGAGRVDFAGGGGRDRELAERLGANVLEPEFPERLGPYPITVDFSASHEGLACALRSTAPDGICTVNAIYFEQSTPLPMLEMYTKGIRLHTGRVHARPAMERALDLVREGRFQPELVTGERAGWDDAAEAFSAHDSKLVISR
ncbi:MAG: dehydrogenase [Solirubrobacterales bacterium]|nr:dehydrogenase [Solirubrobacterales bacterium]